MNNVVRTQCAYCGVGCGIELTVADGPGTRARVVRVNGDSRHPANSGRLCIKGATIDQTLDGPTRLRSVIRQVRQMHEERERRQTEAALESKVFNAEEEHSIVLQMIANKRRQQGLIAPTEG